MTRAISVAAASVLALAIVAALAVQVWLLPSAARSAAIDNPEAAFLETPGVAWGVAVVLCFQAMAAIAIRLLLRQGRPGFRRSLYRAIRVIIGCLVVFFVLLAVAFATLTALEYSSPAQLELVVVAVLTLFAVGGLGVYLGTRYDLDPTQ